ncbi:MAG: NADH:flavin oxidoreductase/NADH oxidase [Desulfuromonadales bacterium]|nr:NADH:flavin oxidoreductase/NADH oxidase [Desulfuromonadales bacterium]MBN2791554.1 NADH:flavin oxidoreductase/NADH oxidase [Desulfuromonadales bacterium]
MSQLFSPLKLRDLTIPNRIFLSPMCQYSSPDGTPNNWHLIHLGTRAVGGAGLILSEATAVSPRGRISPDDLGLWADEQVKPFSELVRFIKDRGCIAGVQLAHAGRKASVDAPWRGGKPLERSERGWEPCAPSSIPFATTHPVPQELTRADLERIEEDFSQAAIRALKAGFQIAEVHAAHGYLLHQFLSPLSNQRSDEYGGTLDNRMRFPLRIAQAVRKIWPEKLPVFVRISATDWVEGGWDLDQAIIFSEKLSSQGIDLIDCSSGGLVADAIIPAGPGFQVPFAESIRQATGIKTAAVGLITEPEQAEQIISAGRADAVLLGRELLRNPYWPMQAARQLGADIRWPSQYERAKI